MGVSERCDLPGFERFLAAESDEIVDLIQHELETLVAALRFEEAATARERRTYAIGYLGRARFAHQFVYRNMAIRDSSTGQSWIFAQGSIVSWSPNGTGSSFDDNADQSFESSASRRTEPIEWALIDRANIVRRYISGAGNRYQHYFF
jgi:hypothetical protein